MQLNQTRRQWPAVAAAVVLLIAGSLLWAGCGEEEDEGEGEPEPCEEFGDCPDGELCDVDEELCVDEYEFECEVNADCPDDLICNADAGEEELACVEDQIEEEDYQVSFVAEDTTDAELYIVGSRDGTQETIDTGDINCAQARSCTVTSDKSHLIVVESNDNDSYDAKVAPLSGDQPAVDGDLEVFAGDINRPRVRGDGVAFERDVEAFVHAFYQEYDGQEFEIAELHDVETTQLANRWDIDPVSQRTMQFIPPGLFSLDIRVGWQGELLSSANQMTQLDGSAVGGGQGSFYLTSIPTGATSDGRLVAFHATGPNEYGECSSDDDCSGAGQTCGANERCYAHEPTIYVIDTDNRDNLGTSCLGHDECGTVHRCDSPTDDFDDGQCAPQRITVGVGPNSNGCEVTRQDGSFSYTHIDGPLSFGPDERVYFVGERDCTSSEMGDDDDEAQYPPSAILAGDPYTGEFEEIYGNTEREDIDLRGCGGLGEGVQDPSECTISIDSARLSPEGNDIVFLGSTATGGVSPGIAQGSMDVWRVRRDGEDPAWIGESSFDGASLSAEAVDFRVHGEVDAEDDDDDSDE